MNLTINAASCPSDWVGFFCHYKDVMPLVLSLIGAATVLVAILNFKNALDQRSFKDVIELHEEIEDCISTYRKNIKDKAENSVISRTVYKLLNIFEFVAEAANAGSATKTTSTDAFRFLMMVLVDISTKDGLAHIRPTLFADQSYADIRIWILRMHARIRPEVKQTFAFLLFGADSNILLERSTAGWFKRRHYIKELRKLTNQF